MFRLVRCEGSDSVEVFANGVSIAVIRFYKKACFIDFALLAEMGNLEDAKKWLERHIHEMMSMFFDD